MTDEPQIVELDPEGAPRMTAVILLVCGLFGVGFLLVNVVFTGEDPYQSMSWPDEDDAPIQERGNITVNVWRGAGSNGEEEEVDERVAERKQAKKPARSTTNPYGLPEALLRYQVPAQPKPPNLPAVPGRTTPAPPTTPGAAPAK
jgi:hypothetical protein